MNRHLYLIQRLTALVLAPLVIVHLVLIFVAVQGGLSGSEILQRTQGNVGWGGFYSIFVIAAALHAPIGIRSVLREWTRLSPRAIDLGCIVFAVMLALTGFRAVIAVI